MLILEEIYHWGIWKEPALRQTQTGHREPEYQLPGRETTWVHRMEVLLLMAS